MIFAIKATKSTLCKPSRFFFNSCRRKTLICNTSKLPKWKYFNLKDFNIIFLISCAKIFKHLKLAVGDPSGNSEGRLKLKINQNACDLLVTSEESCFANIQAPQVKQGCFKKNTMNSLHLIRRPHTRGSRVLFACSKENIFPSSHFKPDDSSFCNLDFLGFFFLCLCMCFKCRLVNSVFKVQAVMCAAAVALRFTVLCGFTQLYCVRRCFASYLG